MRASPCSSFMCGTALGRGGTALRGRYRAARAVPRCAGVTALRGRHCTCMCITTLRGRPCTCAAGPALAWSVLRLRESAEHSGYSPRDHPCVRFRWFGEGGRSRARIAPRRLRAIPDPRRRRLRRRTR